MEEVRSSVGSVEPMLNLGVDGGLARWPVIENKAQKRKILVKKNSRVDDKICRSLSKLVNLVVITTPPNSSAGALRHLRRPPTSFSRKLSPLGAFLVHKIEAAVGEISVVFGDWWHNHSGQEGWSKLQVVGRLAAKDAGWHWRQRRRQCSVSGEDGQNFLRSGTNQVYLRASWADA